MSRSNDVNVDVDEEEDFIKIGSGHEYTDTDSSRHNSHGALRQQTGVNCCYGDHYRRLSIISIICGLSCIGCIALKYSVKAKEARRDPVRSAKFAKKAKRFSIISLLVWFSILALIPVLMALVSYLVTLKD